MSITREEVEKTALLARLRLTEAELDRMTDQMGQILGYMDLLGEVDTEGIEPMAHAIEVRNVLREDRVRESVPREKILHSAPSKDGECYLVPAVLGNL